MKAKTTSWPDRHLWEIRALRDAFWTFTTNIPFYGLAVCCIDHPEVQRLVGLIDDRRVTTYGFSRQADVREAARAAIPRAPATPAA